MTTLRRAIQLLGEAREWTQAGQHGDQNGAKAYQADKRLSDAIDLLLTLERGADVERSKESK